MPYRLYIADDSPPGTTDEVLLSELQENGHYVRRYSRPTSVTSARNALLENLADEPYLLRLDDDFELTANTNIDSQVRLLDQLPSIGAVAGIERQFPEGRGASYGGISPHQGYFARRDRTLLKQSIPLDAWIWSYLADGTRFALADYTRNLLLIRREVFSTVQWDSDLWFEGEHEAFLLDLKASGWLVAFSPDSVHNHNELRDLSSRTHPKAPSVGRDLMNQVFSTRYGVDSVTLSYPVGKA